MPWAFIRMFMVHGKTPSLSREGFSDTWSLQRGSLHGFHSWEGLFAKTNGRPRQGDLSRRIFAKQCWLHLLHWVDIRGHVFLCWSEAEQGSVLGEPNWPQMHFSMLFSDRTIIWWRGVWINKERSQPMYSNTGTRVWNWHGWGSWCHLLIAGYSLKQSDSVHFWMQHCLSVGF